MKISIKGTTEFCCSDQCWGCIYLRVKPRTARNKFTLTLKKTQELKHKSLNFLEIFLESWEVFSVFPDHLQHNTVKCNSRTARHKFLSRLSWTIFRTVPNTTTRNNEKQFFSYRETVLLECIFPGDTKVSR